MLRRVYRVQLLSAEAVLASMDLILAAMAWCGDGDGVREVNIDSDAMCDSLHAEAITSTRCATREAGMGNASKRWMSWYASRPGDCHGWCAPSSWQCSIQRTKRTHVELKEATTRKFSQSVTALCMQLTLAVDREWTGSAALLPNDVAISPSSDDTPQCGSYRRSPSLSPRLHRPLNPSIRVAVMHSRQTSVQW
jgi:hypothetical protein